MEACVSGLNSLPGDILPIGSIRDTTELFLLRPITAS
jgi:hypothetical protein